MADIAAPQTTNARCHRGAGEADMMIMHQGCACKSYIHRIWGGYVELGDWRFWRAQRKRKVRQTRI
jgi:hypothetical protein